MNKIIAFIVLLTSAILVYLYFDQPSTSSTIEKEKEQSTQPQPALPPPPVVTKKTSNDKHQQTITPPRAPIKPPPAPSTKKATPQPKAKPQHQPDDINNVDEEAALSYPIEDAEIYFVPPEQRYPGNLGGPPPLDFPDPGF